MTPGPPSTPPAPLRETRELQARRQLDPGQRARLDAGQHLEVARELTEQDQRALAGWVHEQIWDFEQAASLYREVRHYTDALRCGVVSRDQGLLARVVEDIESDPELSAQEVRALATWLHQRKRPEHAATLWALLKQGAQPLALALEESGDHLAACRALVGASDPAGALDRIEQRPESSRPAAYDALAAEAHWQLGDIEQSAEMAQRALTKGLRDRSILETLARSLVSLSYPIGAETILGELPGTAGALGRYRATGILPANYAGVAYSAIDRRRLEEVEVHLLLGEKKEQSARSERALMSFSRQAKGAVALGHPGIRPIIALEPETGIMVLPRADGGLLSALIRPPGLSATPSRVVAIVLRMAKALLAAQAHGLNHGALLPSQIVTDAAGRPMLGPFGAQHLAGLAATRTSSLDELIHFTAPELRGESQASEAGDVYALARIFVALWEGKLSPGLRADNKAPIPQLLRRALSQDPGTRPSLQVLCDALREIRFDVGTLSSQARAQAAHKSLGEGALAQPGPLRDTSTRAGILVEVHESCSMELLDALCERSLAGCQSILDREGRRLWLAPWPAGTGRASTQDQTADTRTQGRTLELCQRLSLDQARTDEFTRRVGPTDWVRLPSGETMLELVGPLTAADLSQLPAEHHA